MATCGVAGLLPLALRAAPASLALLGLLAAAPARAGEPAPRVTTDSVAYCSALAARAAAHPASRSEPSLSLVTQGMELCDSGHVRAGIARLRRAMRAAQGTQAIQGG
jgi:hypothetical protein